MNRDPLLWNKILGAVLGALLIGTLSAFAADLLHGEEHGEKEEVALSLVSVEPSSAEASSATETSVAEAEVVVPLADLIARADVAHGKDLSRKCTACHTFTPDGANRIGPNLWKIVGRSVAAVSDFSYSKAMKNFGGTWSDEKLSAFLQKPREAVAGTKMNFVGIKKAQDRADIIAWLQTLK